MKIDFLIAGAQKSGTTALWSYLKKHPRIQMPDKKELHFFNQEENFVGHHPDGVLWSEYNQNWKNDDRLKGECTPIYMWWETAPRRIWEYNPDIKIIVVLRNPIERTFSQWAMERSRGSDTASFRDAILNEIDRGREWLPKQHAHYAYVSRGRYCEQLRRLWRYFTPNVSVIRYEDLRDNPQKVMNRVTGFLEVDSFEVEPLKINVTNYPRKMNEAEHGMLKRIFEFEIKELERMLNWDLSDWLK